MAQYMGLDADTILIDSHIPMDESPAFPQELYCDHARALPSTTGYRLLESDVYAHRLQHKIAVGKIDDEQSKVTVIYTNKVYQKRA